MTNNGTNKTPCLHCMGTGKQRYARGYAICGMCNGSGVDRGRHIGEYLYPGVFNSNTLIGSPEYFEILERILNDLLESADDE